VLHGMQHQGLGQVRKQCYHNAIALKSRCQNTATTWPPHYRHIATASPYVLFFVLAMPMGCVKVLMRANVPMKSCHAIGEAMIGHARMLYDGCGWRMLRFSASGVLADA
jgi:hypothetical protein